MAIIAKLGLEDVLTLLRTVSNDDCEYDRCQKVIERLYLRYPDWLSKLQAKPRALTSLTVDIRLASDLLNYNNKELNKDMLSLCYRRLC